DRQASTRNLPLVLGEETDVPDRLPVDLRDPEPDVEFLLEGEGPMKVERGGDAGPADLRIGRMNTQPRLAPERMLRFLHIAEEPAEVHDSCCVRFVELNATAQTIFARHVVNPGTHLT